MIHNWLILNDFLSIEFVIELWNWTEIWKSKKFGRETGQNLAKFRKIRMSIMMAVQKPSLKNGSEMQKKLNLSSNAEKSSPLIAIGK